jgi:hypothetical protein
MTTFLIGAAIGVIAKTLLPWPWADDKIRAAWRWAWSKVT